MASLSLALSHSSSKQTHGLGSMQISAHFQNKLLQTVPPSPTPKMVSSLKGLLGGLRGASVGPGPGPGCWWR